MRGGMGTIAVQRRKAGTSGFSLLELSIFLIIVGFILATALQFGSSKEGFARIKHTQDKLRIINEAMISFVKLNGRLPCPAVGSLALNNAALGDEDCAGTLIAATTPDIHAGIVPVNALNISREFMFDGWDNRITYVVDSQFVDPITFESTAATNAGLRIMDGENIATVRQGNAVFVLISAGSDGHGVWPRNGGTRRNLVTLADTAEQENAENPPTTFDLDYAQTMPNDTFDDLVLYSFKNKILFEAGGLFNAKECIEAQLTLMPIDNKALPPNPPPSDPANYPIEGPIGCEDPAAVINNETDYRNATRALDCMVRQVKLAEEIVKRCIYER